VKFTRKISTSAGTRRYLLRAILGLITTAGVLGHIVGYYEVPYIDQIENLLYDTRVRLTAPGGIDDRIVIVAIDESSLERLGHWPFTREKFAQLMNNLFSYGAEVVSFDDLVAAGSMAEAKAKGRVRIEGKDYVMADGDVVEFRFNV